MPAIRTGRNTITPHNNHTLPYYGIYPFFRLETPALSATNNFTCFINDDEAAATAITRSVLLLSTTTTTKEQASTSSSTSTNQSVSRLKNSERKEAREQRKRIESNVPVGRPQYGVSGRKTSPIQSLFCFPLFVWGLLVPTMDRDRCE